MEVLDLKINSRIKRVLGSSTLAITARAKELKAEGKDVVNFAGGEPDFDTPQSIKDAAIEAIKAGATKYTPSTGTLELKKAICEKFKKDNGLDYSPAQIAVSCGAKHSVFNIIQVLSEDGDEVLIPTPYWVSYPEMVKLSGAEPVFVNTTIEDNFKLTEATLTAGITPKTKLLILNSPSNPTGVLYSKEELQVIADICVKHNIFVISDEIYEKLIYDNREFVSIASLGEEINRLTVTINGVSKAYSMTGWRIGYCGGHEDIIGYVKKFQDHSTSNPTSISQAAACQALSEPDSMTDAFQAIFTGRRKLIMSLFDDISQVSYVCPDGAFYIFCDFSAFGASDEVAKSILNDVNVALIPGEGFGAPGYMRISFATSDERIETGVARIKSWIEKQA